MNELIPSHKTVQVVSLAFTNCVRNQKNKLGNNEEISKGNESLLEHLRREQKQDSVLLLMLGDDEELLENELCLKYRQSLIAASQLPFISADLNLAAIFPDRKIIIDQTKISTLLAKIHKAASENPHAQIYFDAYHDNANEKIWELIRFFNNYKNFIPKNVELRIFKYEGGEPELKLTVGGTGNIYSNFEWVAGQLAAGSVQDGRCQPNRLKENVLNEILLNAQQEDQQEQNSIEPEKQERIEENPEMVLQDVMPVAQHQGCEHDDSTALTIESLYNQLNQPKSARRNPEDDTIIELLTKEVFPRIPELLEYERNLPPAKRLLDTYMTINLIKKGFLRGQEQRVDDFISAKVVLTYLEPDQLKYHFHEASTLNALKNIFIQFLSLKDKHESPSRKSQSVSILTKSNLTSKYTDEQAQFYMRLQGLVNDFYLSSDISTKIITKINYWSACLSSEMLNEQGFVRSLIKDPSRELASWKIFRAGFLEELKTNLLALPYVEAREARRDVLFQALRQPEHSLYIILHQEANKEIYEQVMEGWEQSELIQHLGDGEYNITNKIKQIGEKNIPSASMLECLLLFTNAKQIISSHRNELTPLTEEIQAKLVPFEKNLDRQTKEFFLNIYLSISGELISADIRNIFPVQEEEIPSLLLSVERFKDSFQLAVEYQMDALNQDDKIEKTRKKTTSLTLQKQEEQIIYDFLNLNIEYPDFAELKALLAKNEINSTYQFYRQLGEFIKQASFLPVANKITEEQYKFLFDCISEGKQDFINKYVPVVQQLGKLRHKLSPFFSFTADDVLTILNGQDVTLFDLIIKKCGERQTEEAAAYLFEYSSIYMALKDIYGEVRAGMADEKNKPVLEKLYENLDYSMQRLPRFRLVFDELVKRNSTDAAEHTQKKIQNMIQMANLFTFITEINDLTYKEQSKSSQGLESQAKSIISDFSKLLASKIETFTSSLHTLNLGIEKGAVPDWYEFLNKKSEDVLRELDEKLLEYMDKHKFSEEGLSKKEATPLLYRRNSRPYIQLLDKIYTEVHKKAAGMANTLPLSIQS